MERALTAAATSCTRFIKEQADTSNYFEAILAKPGCFSSSDVGGAKTWLVDAHPAGNAVNAYLYCWNTGAPSPHRLGHEVSGDHLCAYRELRSAASSVDAPATHFDLGKLDQ